MSFNEDDDDFADFQNCTFEQEPGQTEANRVSEPDEDFADFSDFQNANSTVNSNRVCDQADHQVGNQIGQQRSNEASKVPATNESPKFESVLKDAFPNAELADNVNTDDNQAIIIKEFFTDEQKRSLWNQIQNLEESPSLKLRWNKTQSFQNFLSALRINPKQTSNNPHVPVFASSLGLLEPIKLKANQENEPKEHITNHVNCRAPTHSAAKVADRNCAPQPDSIPLGSLNKNLIDDLGSFDTLNQPDKAGQPMNGLTRPASAYDKLIKNIKPDSNPKKNEEAGLDANKILDELPILNFMRSNTLMFNQ